MNRPADFQPPAGTPAPRDASTVIRDLTALRRQPRERLGYWNDYCTLLRELCRAGTALLVQRSAEGGWRLLGGAAGDDWALRHWPAVVAGRAGQPMEKGFAVAPLQDEAGRLRMLALVQVSGLPDALLVIDIPESERAQLNELLMRAMLVADVGAGAFAPAPSLGKKPADKQASSALAAFTGKPDAAPAGADTDTAALFDLTAQVVAEARFDAATLVLVNGLAAHYGASLVALGWRHGGAVRTVALSHVDRFERNTEQVQLLDEAFLEALGQPGPVWIGGDLDLGPDPEAEAGAPVLARVARSLTLARMYALPVPDGVGGTRAVLLFGFAGAAASPPAPRALLQTMGFLQPWLEAQRGRERWWGLRLRDWSGQRLARWLGPGRVWTRSAVAALSLLLLFAVFGTWDYRIEASAQLSTDSTRLISAQFDGRVDAVQATAGDVVKAGAPLAALDTRELRQQQLDLGAERQRLGAEADKARATGNLADLGIAQARAAQADARLARVAQYLAQAQTVAPFDGVVVAGERKDLLNAPVKKGDNLFRISRIDGLYVEIMVPERDVRFVHPGAHGELRLIGRPDETIGFTLATVIPVAQVKGQEGNHFLVKGRLDGAPQAWWRPGMSGIVQLDGGRRNVAWIWTHRLVDSLRMKLWWLG